MSGSTSVASVGGVAPLASDGRVQRGERTRVAIVSALLDLLDHGVVEPPSQQIADRAGVSVRSIFQHFDDIESLYGALARAQAERTRALFEALDTDGDLATRIDQLGAHRSTLFENIAPVRHALGARARSSPAVRQRLDEASLRLRTQVERQFATEFVASAEDDRRPLIEALDLLWSFDSWDRLRTAQRLTVEESEATLRTATVHLLRPGARPAERS